MAGIYTGGVVPNDIRRAVTNARAGRTLDGQGDILAYEDFRDDLSAWTLTPIAVGSALDLSVTQHLPGRSFSLRMQGGVGASGTGASAVLPLSIALLAPMAVELAFTVDANATFVNVVLSVANGTQVTDFTISANTATGQLQLENATGNFTNVVPISLATTAGLFHRLKAVFNVAASTYDRVILDAQQIAFIAGVAARTAASALAPTVQVGVNVGPGAVTSPVTFVGQVIVTQNEVL